MLIDTAISKTFMETTRVVVLGLQFTFTFFGSLFIHWINLSNRNSICSLQDNLSLLFHDVDMKKTQSKGAKIFVIMFFVTYVVTTISTYFGSCMPLLESNNIPKVRCFIEC